MLEKEFLGQSKRVCNKFTRASVKVPAEGLLQFTPPPTACKTTGFFPVSAVTHQTFLSLPMCYIKKDVWVSFEFEFFFRISDTEQEV